MSLYALSGLVFYAAGLFWLWRVEVHSPQPFFISLHLFNFWSVVVLHNVVTLLVAGSLYNDYLVFALEHALLFVYVLSMLLLYRPMTTRLALPSAGETIELLTTPNHLMIQAAMVVYLAFKLYAFQKYGFSASTLLATSVSVRASYLDVILFSLLRYVGLGALVVFTAKAVLRPIFAPRFLVSAGLASLTYTFQVLFIETSGARRMTFLFAVYSILLVLYRVRFRPRLRHVALVLALAVALPGFFEYFQRIRVHAHDPRLSALLRSGELSEVATGTLKYLRPEQGTGSRLLANLEMRDSPFRVLYAITDEQLSSFRVAGGRLFVQAFYNNIPRSLAPRKRVVNADVILSEVFHLPYGDLPSGILSIFQAEMDFLGYILAPILYLVLFAFYARFTLRGKHNYLLLLIGSGFLFSTAFSVESTLDSVVSDLRNFVLLYLLGLGLGLAWDLFTRSGFFGSRIENPDLNR